MPCSIETRRILPRKSFTISAFFGHNGLTPDRRTRRRDGPLASRNKNQIGTAVQRRTISCCHELNPDFVDHDQQSVVEARARKARLTVMQIQKLHRLPWARARAIHRFATGDQLAHDRIRAFPPRVAGALWVLLEQASPNRYVRSAYLSRSGLRVRVLRYGTTKRRHGPKSANFCDDRTIGQLFSSESSRVARTVGI